MNHITAAVPAILMATLIIVWYARRVAEERRMRRYIYLVYTMRQ